MLEAQPRRCDFESLNQQWECASTTSLRHLPLAHTHTLLQEQLNASMGSLMTDADRHVAAAARGMHDAYKHTPLRVAGGGSSASGGAHARTHASTLGCAV